MAAASASLRAEISVAVARLANNGKGRTTSLSPSSLSYRQSLRSLPMTALGLIAISPIFRSARNGMEGFKSSTYVCIHGRYTC